MGQHLHICKQCNGGYFENVLSVPRNLYVEKIQNYVNKSEYERDFQIYCHNELSCDSVMESEYLQFI